MYLTRYREVIFALKAYAIRHSKKIERRQIRSFRMKYSNDSNDVRNIFENTCKTLPFFFVTFLCDIDSTSTAYCFRCLFVPFKRSHKWMSCNNKKLFLNSLTHTNCSTVFWWGNKNSNYIYHSIYRLLHINSSMTPEIIQGMPFVTIIRSQRKKFVRIHSISKPIWWIGCGFFLPRKRYLKKKNEWPCPSSGHDKFDLNLNIIWLCV